MAKVRLADIARKVGVSTATVSRAIRNELPDSSPVRDDVLHAAKRMGYQMPQRQVRQLGKVTLVTLGIDVGRPSGRSALAGESGFYGRFVYGVQAGVREHGGVLALHATESAADLRDTIKNVVKETDADGLVLLGGFVGSTAVVDPGSVPVVLLNAVADEQAYADAVASADTGGIEAVVRHLHGLGHRRIGFWTHSRRVGHHEQRLSAYVSATTHLGLRSDNVFVDQVSDRPYADRMAEEFKRFVAMPISERPTAMVCSTDTHALALLRLAQEHQISVPRQLSVVGFDNTDGSVSSIPGLSTVDVGLEDMGREAIHLLVRRLRHPDEPFRQVVLRARLVDRQTIAAAE